MVDHTIEAHFKVDAGAAFGAPKSPEQQKEDRVVASMVDVIAPSGNRHQRFQADMVARQIYRAVMAMNDALAKE